MPLLIHRSRQPDSALASEPEAATMSDRTFRPALVAHCSNPNCGSSWLRLFRHRSVPVFEGKWTCSAECTESCVLSALRREIDGRSATREMHRHRIPLGLLMLERGWITREQLRAALRAQEAAGTGRIGEWLVEQHATDEATVTRALGLQWSCPILYPE